MTANASSTPNRISTFMLLIILIVMALSLVALALAANAFILGEQIVAAYMLAIAFIAMGLSSYVLLQSRRRMTTMKIATPVTMTTIECRKCGFKSIREFQRGDYVFKELEMCQKCDDRQMITAIYKEVKEKEKTYNF
jgi:ribosomal protein L40E